MMSMNDQGISVKHKRDRRGNRTAGRIESHIQPARNSDFLSSHLEEVPNSILLDGKGSRTAYLLATDKMVYCQAFFWRITLV